MTGLRHRECTNSGGFTLVELLVALSVMAIVLGLVGSSLSFSARSADSIEAGVSATEEIYLVQEALRRQMQLAQPVKRVDEAGSGRLDYAATSKSLEFVAPMPGPGGYDGFYRISLTIEEDPFADGAGGRLVMRHRIYIPAADPTAPPVDAGERIVLGGFASGDFAFLDSRSSNADWTGNWRQTGRLPEFVRLQINWPEASGRRFPDLVVAVKAAGQGAGEEG